MGMINTFRSVVQFKELELDPVVRRLSTAADIGDLRTIAKRRLPRGVFDYIDGGAEDELTLGANSSAFSKIQFEPRVLRDVSKLDTSTTMFGTKMAMPVMIAPTGFGRIAQSQGELAVARAAERAGIPYALSTMATRSIEEVAAVSDGPKWFQVYTWRDRTLVEQMVRRAEVAGYVGLYLTVDTAVLGRRERDVRRGYTLPPKIGLDTIIDGAIHPGWTWDFLNNDPITFANVVGMHDMDGSSAVSLAEHMAAQFDSSLSWDDVAWLASIWDGPIILKGIQSVADAKLAVEAGVAGIALSNHGGRQLDGAPTPIELVEPVAQAVGGQIEIICDGGIRRGSDVVKALALGADAVSIGRPYLYGLAAGGERGVDHVLKFFSDGIRRTMALSGVRTIAEINRDLVSWV